MMDMCACEQWSTSQNCACQVEVVGWVKLLAEVAGKVWEEVGSEQS